MNFYLDFEALQFSERIISIGCVAENGSRFNTLVKPVKDEKVNSFITKLTGITNKMLEDAPTADEAFNAFYSFVRDNNGNGIPSYYCYGHNDRTFIKKTISGMNDFQAITFASSVKGLLVDFSKTATAHLGIKSISLKNLVTLVRHEDVVQKHDALDDAVMLKECYEKLDTLEKADSKPEPVKIVKNNMLEASAKLIEAFGELPSIKIHGHGFVQWEIDYLKGLRSKWRDIKLDDFLGDGTPDNWKAKLTKISTGEVTYFTEPWVAAMFINYYILAKRSSKDLKVVNATMKEMALNPNMFAGYRSEFKF